MQKQDKC